MKQFHSTFYELRNETELTIQSFEKIFTKKGLVDPSAFEGGSVQYQDGKVEYSLQLIADLDANIMAVYSCYDHGSKRNIECYYSVGDQSKLGEFIDVGDEEFYPLGVFIPSKHAYFLLHEFLELPMEKSLRIDWVSQEKIDWSLIGIV